MTSLDLYPEISHEGDLTPDYGEDIDDACVKIMKACKGFGTDEEALIETIGPKTPTERWLISNRYPEIYDGKDLYKLIKSETSKDWGTLCQLLSCKPEEAEAHMVHKACKGFGTNEKLLYTVICGRSKADMTLLKKTYYKLYNKDLTVLLSKELSGSLELLLVSCAQGIEEEYDPEYHTEEKAEEDCEAFYEAGQGKWGTNEKKLFKIISLSPPEHLKAVDKCYVDKYGNTLWKAAEKELSGTVQDAAMYTIGMKTKPYDTMAWQIKKACMGFGTDETALSFCMVQYQQHMQQVMIAHEELFDKTLVDRIESETGGKYKQLLLHLTGLPGV